MLDGIGQTVDSFGPVFAHGPSTFAERGFVAPFTTPLLGGARVRAGTREAELVIANPSGGRGVYVLPWAGVREFCSPTVHDRMLYAKLHAGCGITQAAIRAAALDIAEAGFAGPAAATSARAARVAHAAETASIKAGLLRVLVRDTADAEPWVGGGSPGAGRSPENARMADPSAEAADCLLNDLTDAVLPIGGCDALGASRAGTLIVALARLRDESADGVAGAATDDQPALMAIGAAADQAVSSAQAALAEARGLLADVPRLLRCWLMDRAAVEPRLLRPLSLLDGWERLCLLWDEAKRGGPSPAREIAAQIPVLPGRSEVGSAARESHAASRFHRPTPAPADADGGGHSLDLIARNERLRAGCPWGPT